MAVLMKAGHTALTRMPAGRNSTAATRDSCTTPALLAQYEPNSGAPPSPAREAMLTITPPGLGSTGSAAFMPSHTPFTLISIRRSNSSSVWSKSGLTISMPALLIMMSRPPKALTVACTAASISWATVTSQRTARTASPSSSAAPLAPASSMSAISTCAPRSTRSREMARPRPWAPPVTNARFPSSSPIAISFCFVPDASALSTAARPATECSPKDDGRLWRGLQELPLGMGGEEGPLHRPPDLEGDDRPFEDRARELFEPAEPVPDGVLVHVERFGGGLHAEAVLDEGAHGLEDGRRLGAELLERAEVAADQQLAQLVLGGDGDPQRQVLQAEDSGAAEALRHLEHPAGGGEGRLEGGEVDRGAGTDDAGAIEQGRRPGRDPDDVAFEDVDEGMVADGPG